MGALSFLRAPERSGRALYILIWTLLALPMPIDLWVGYFRHPGDEAARQWMNVDTGLWAVRIFLIGMATSPAARLLHEPAIARYRKTISLFAFAYAMIHSLDYVFYAHPWRFALRVWEGRLYLVVGILASVMMIPLAITSLGRVRRKIGPRRWKALHASIYAIAVLTAVHIALCQYLTNFAEAMTYCVLLIGLLLLRLPPVMSALLRLQPGHNAGVSGSASRQAS